MRYVNMAFVLGLGVTACGEDTAGGSPDTTPADDVVALVDTSDTSVDTSDTSADSVDNADATTTPLDTAGSETSPEIVEPPTDTTTSPADATTTDTADATATDTDVSAPDPAATGPFAFTREELTVEGFDALLFVPTTTEAVPAIVLAPGFQLGADAFEFYGRHLASHGIGTLIPTFGDSIFAPRTHSALADATVAMVDWLAADARFDAAQLGAAGHSRGGKVAILAATRSTAVRAVFGLDPVDTAGGPGAQPSADNPSVTPELMDAVTVPFAVLGSAYGGTATSAFAPACAPTEENYQQYALGATNATFSYEWLAPASGHNDFADPLPFLLSLACKAGDNPAATRTLAKTRLVAFFKRHLEGDLRYTLP